MTAVDNHHAMDFPALDFYHLPFESDLPQDILEFSCATQRDAVDDYSTSILTPPPTAYPSDDEETFTLGQIQPLAPEGSPACVASSALVAGADSSGHFVPSIWATPPASPPLTSFSAPPPRFSHPFRAATQPFFDGPASSDDESFDSYESSPSAASAPAPRRRKSSSGSGAGKAPRKSKDSLASSAAAFAAQRRSLPSPEPTSSAYNSDCEEEPEVKRNTHNVLERKRRNDLKRSYQNLRMQLPNLSGQQRAPTGAILTKAAEYIAELRAVDARAAAMVEHLRRENARAHARLRAARAAAAYM